MVRLRNTRDAWGAGAQLLHWLIAAGIATAMLLGWIMVNMPMGPAKFQLYAIHKSLGMTILALVLVRIAWRWLNIVPAMPGTLSAREKQLAGAGHLALYGLMLFMPISGYVLNSAANFPLNVFGLVQIPNLTPESETLASAASLVHLTLFWVFAAVLVTHIGAALRHHFVLGDDVLRRMLPIRRR